MSTPSHVSSSAHLDDAVLAELRAIGPDVLKDVVQLFIADVPERIGRLEQAFTAQAADEILREAHSLKGTALAVGATTMVHECAAIEQAARAGKIAEAAAHRRDLEQEFTGVCRALEAMC